MRSESLVHYLWFKNIFEVTKQKFPTQIKYLILQVLIYTKSNEIFIYKSVNKPYKFKVRKLNKGLGNENQRK